MSQEDEDRSRDGDTSNHLPLLIETEMMIYMLRMNVISNSHQTSTCTTVIPNYVHCSLLLLSLLLLQLLTMSQLLVLLTNKCDVINAQQLL